MGWQVIEIAPVGDEENGPFFDVAWEGVRHSYLPVGRRVMNCYRRGNVIACRHGYPAVTTIFDPQPTHWLKVPDVGANCAVCAGADGPIYSVKGEYLGALAIGIDGCCQYCTVD